MRIGAALFAFLLRAGGAESAVDGATQASIIVTPIHFQFPYTHQADVHVGQHPKVDSPEPNLFPTQHVFNTSRRLVTLMCNAFREHSGNRPREALLDSL